jgi:hypothetical protein
LLIRCSLPGDVAASNRIVLRQNEQPIVPIRARGARLATQRVSELRKIGLLMGLRTSGQSCPQKT